MTTSNYYDSCQGNDDEETEVEGPQLTCSERQGLRENLTKPAALGHRFALSVTLTQPGLLYQSVSFETQSDINQFEGPKERIYCAL
jgi:hypothetical protein